MPVVNNLAQFAVWITTNRKIIVGKSLVRSEAGIAAVRLLNRRFRSASPNPI